MDGIINVLKPPGVTSSDVVVYLRRLLGVKKVGHGGTLDPAAAGVLVVCVGKATRLSDYIMEAPKAYIGGMALGMSTDTLDSEGQIIYESKELPNFVAIEKAFEDYKGVILQDPPMYSARKYRGKRLYELARQGQEVKVPPRQVEIFENKILEYIEPNQIIFETHCTKGTYIRSLARDIGDSLGCGAYLSFLIRISSGPFLIEDSFHLDEIRKYFLDGQIQRILLPMDVPLSGFKAVEVGPRGYIGLKNGNIVALSNIISDPGDVPKDELLRVYCRDQFIGLGSIDRDKGIRMKKVLI